MHACIAVCLKPLPILLAAFVPSVLAGQSVEDEVMKPVRQLFEAMRTRDTAAIRSVVHPDARLIGTAADNGAPTVNVLTMDRFIASVGRAQVELVERIWDSEVRVHDNLATVWTKYDFLAGDEFSHCGVDAFQLVRVPSGEWKIVQIADTRRRTDCWRMPGS